MENDRHYAHRWLQDVIGWIVGLMDIITRIFSGGCFITTAVVEHLGLPDNSKEMRLFRDLREDCLHRDTRRLELEEYLSTAPTIVSWVNSRRDAGEIWTFTAEYVLATAQLLERNRFDEAYSLFRDRTRSLVRDVLDAKHLHGSSTLCSRDVA